MRIGILTFHSAHNYGAVLQCFALQQYLSKRHDVYVIDYRPNSIVKGYHWFLWRRFVCKNPLKMFVKSVREISLIRYRKKRFEGFNKFIENKIKLAEVSTIHSQPYDYIIIGSDQVWNYNLTNGFDDYFWGKIEIPTCTKIISYAASMHDSWPKEIDIQILDRLKNFTSISVRENQLALKLSKLLNKPIQTVVDPTLLLKKEQWELITRRIIREKYLLLYQVEQNQTTIDIAHKIANQLNLRLIAISAQVEGLNSKEIITSSPEDFVSLFRYANFVVCSSFHGTIFSLLFNVPFYSVRMGVGKDNRVASLLSDLSLENRFIDHWDDTQYGLNYCINDKALDNMVMASESYLFNELV